MLLYLASDLMWATRIKATADDLKIPCRPVRTLEMLQARLADSPVKALIIDLESEVGVEMVQFLRSVSPAMPIVCFAPHVKKEVMTAAKAAGATEVLPRGAFDANLPSILQKLSVI